PQLLLLDEPLSALDVGTRSHLRRTLAEHLREFAGPRLLITHDPAEAFLLADFICILENGTISQAGKGDEIRMRPRSAYAADLAGLNLFRGVAETGIVTLEGGHHIAVGDLSVKGPVLITIHPRAVALYRTVPEGSPRNTWPTTITLIERLGDRARVQVGAPVPLTAEVTSAAIAALRLVEGVDIWVAFKATEVGVAEDDEAAPEG
ncbi:MAG: TOBE domain-containing protein, partial [Acidimicrobiia bacterium]|nr:TOBE domain-containing protein [Acidimicrobiia bacterium]